MPAYEDDWGNQAYNEIDSLHDPRLRDTLEGLQTPDPLWDDPEELFDEDAEFVGFDEDEF